MGKYLIIWVLKDIHFLAYFIDYEFKIQNKEDGIVIPKENIPKC